MKEKRQEAGSQVAYEILLRGWLIMTRELDTEVTISRARDTETNTSSP